MKCLIVGTGGVGGSLAALLALAGEDVACIVRGEHKQRMLEHGLRFHSDMVGEQVIPCVPYGKPVENTGKGRLKICSAGDYTDEADLILVCVKGYSIDTVAPVIVDAAGPHTIVLPILNVYGTGPRVAAACPGVRVIDGCIYIVGFVNAPGEVTQQGKICKLVFGARSCDGVPRSRLEAVRDVLAGAGIKAVLSDDINRDTFAKWSFISAMACTGAYFDVPMGALQHSGPARDLFNSLTRESTALGERMGICFRENPIQANIRIIDNLLPDTTASLQKDLERGRESEIQGLLFDMLDACEKNGIDAPAYRQVAGKFGKG